MPSAFTSAPRRVGRQTPAQAADFADGVPGLGRGGAHAGRLEASEGVESVPAHPSHAPFAAAQGLGTTVPILLAAHPRRPPVSAHRSAPPSSLPLSSGRSTLPKPYAHFGGPLGTAPSEMPQLAIAAPSTIIHVTTPDTTTNGSKPRHIAVTVCPNPSVPVGISTRKAATDDLHCHQDQEPSRSCHGRHSCSQRGLISSPPC